MSAGSRPRGWRRWLPAPRLTLALAAAWLLLAQSLSPGQGLLAFAFGLAIPRFVPVGPAVHLHHLGTLLRLAGRVGADVVLANIEVARLVLGPEAALRPRFVWVPMTLRDPHALAALAGIVSLTPGTLSCDFSDDRRWLLVHALDCADEAALVASIQTRYEAPLRAIFE